MVDATPAKRVLPARDRRESTAKRARYSPAPSSTTKKAAPPSKPSTPASDAKPKRKYTKRTSTVRTPTPRDASTPPVEDVLPTKVTNSKPLPTTKEKQAAKLSPKEYQSIAESAILSASLYRSRVQWLSDGIFKKYWVKPVKRKGVVEQPPNNPDAKSMSKLGNGTITIEPHKLDVTFYTVREQQQVPAPQPHYKHPNQHTPKPPAVGTVSMGPPQNPGAQTPNAPPPNTVPTPQKPPTPQSQPMTPAVKQESAPSTPVPATPGSVGKPPTQQTIQTPAAAPKANSDPVIQMLAARAATDARLKDLMKVVATSKATPDQLKEFQKHIDEFNAVVKKQEADKAGREPQQTPVATPVQEPVATQQPPPRQEGPQQAVASPSTQHAAGAAVATAAPTSAPVGAPTGPATGPPASSTPTPVTTQPPPHNSPAPRPPAPYAAYPAPRMEAIIKHIVLEFHGDGASTDRFLFPDYAALDLRYGGLEMNATFALERKGSEIISSLGDSAIEEVAAAQAKWKADVEYYEPITITVRANQHRTIETIARAARTLPEVQEHMKKILETKTRAPVEYLVHQLPREKGVAGSEVPSAEMVDSGVEMGSEDEDDELKAFYGHY